METLAEAKEHVGTLLALADGNGDAVYAAIDRAARATRAGCTREQWEAHSEQYALQRLALADLTGNAGYRL